MDLNVCVVFQSIAVITVGQIILPIVGHESPYHWPLHPFHVCPMVFVTSLLSVMTRTPGSFCTFSPSDID